MSMRPYTRIMLGVCLTPPEIKELNINYEAYTKYFEGHAGVRLQFNRGEGDANVYCGIPLSSVNWDGAIELKSYSVIDIAKIKEEASTLLAELFNKSFDVQLLIFSQWL
jgi:hypothetical protein